MYTTGWQQPFGRIFTYCQPNYNPLHSKGYPKPKQLLSEWNIPTLCEMKADLLSNKLKQKTKQSTTTDSRLTLSVVDKQFRSPTMNKQLFSVNDFQQRIRKRMSIIETSHEGAYANLVVLRELTYTKSKKASEDNLNSQNEIKAELQVITYSLQQMSALSAKQRVSPQFNIYSDILNQLQLSKQIQLERNSIKHINTPLFDCSLLLSCKKNIEKQEDYVTLKYSEDSHLMRHQPFSSGQLSAEDDKINTRIKDQIKDKIQFKDIQSKFHPINTEDRQSYDKQQIDHKLWIDLHSTKDDLIDRQNSIRKALQTYEDVLQKLIQEIAQQKVQSQASWTNLLTSTEQSLDQIVISLTQLSATSKAHDYHFEESLTCLEKSLSSKFFIQSQNRKEQCHTAMKMILQIVSDLQ